VWKVGPAVASDLQVGGFAQERGIGVRLALSKRTPVPLY
jgi:hypothetical protein